MREYIDEKLIKVTCNMCGKYADQLWNDSNYWMEEPFKEIDLVYGYGSELFDFNGIKFDICEHCIEKLVSQFKYPAKVREYVMSKDENGDLCYKWIDE